MQATTPSSGARRLILEVHPPDELDQEFNLKEVLDSIQEVAKQNEFAQYLLMGKAIEGVVEFQFPDIPTARKSIEKLSQFFDEENITQHTPIPEQFSFMKG